MFETVLGIPAHPLLIHAAVVFVPLLVLGAVSYALVPGWRGRIDWAVVLLAIIAPGAALFAKLSGDAFRNRLVRERGVSAPDLAKIVVHQSYGNRTSIFAAVLGVLALALVGRQVWYLRQPGGAAGSRVLSIGLTVVTIATALVTGYFVVMTGDTGAHIVWQGR